MIAAQRYAQAILKISAQHKCVEEVYTNSVELSNIIKNNRDLYNFLSSPLIKSDKKKKILHTFFGGKINKILMELIDILCIRRREGILFDIVNAIVTEYKKQHNIVTATLVSSYQFDEESKKVLSEKIKSIKKASKIDLIEKIDQSLIGGFIIKTDEEQIDASIKNKLNQLYNQFTNQSSLN